MGRVVNITKFGAFVNILPCRDGLVHISKLGGGKRINAVEDVLTLGEPIEVRVDEIDDKGKVSLVPVGDVPAESATGAASDEVAGDGDGDSRTEERVPVAAQGGPVEMSFEESFDAELAADLGDLGPTSDRKGGNGGSNRRGGRRRHR